MASGVNETIHAQLTLVPFQYHKAKNKLANAHFTRLCELLKIIQTRKVWFDVGYFNAVIYTVLY